MNAQELFYDLLYAETERKVESVLASNSLLIDDGRLWKPLGGFENNFAAVSNQQSDATAALIEKIINGIDAVLMANAFSNGTDPQGSSAPRSMSAAVEQFYGVREGRIGSLSLQQTRELADNIHVVAVGAKSDPSYLIVDRGEGQCPELFPDTFLSILKSNKMRIPFVQGKFNSGGLGTLQFCGEENVQLIVSRRHPDAPRDKEDTTADDWGFTIVRRLDPSEGQRSSMYVYLAPEGRVPSFKAESISVLPGPSAKNAPGRAYSTPLEHGTCVKLYQFRWNSRTVITLDAFYNIEKLLHTAALPFRLHETRDYKANYFSTTVKGGWVTATSSDSDEDDEERKLEPGFPASAELDLPGIGTLRYGIAVFTPMKDAKRVPKGVYFTVNGQVHGDLGRSYVTNYLKKLSYIDDKGPLFVTVDCTAMDPRTREDFFMASRDRVRKNETYSMIRDRLSDELNSHPGLREIHQRRRQTALEKAPEERTVADLFHRLIDADPSIASLFGAGDKLVTRTGPEPRPEFCGRKFPTYFRLVNEPRKGLVKRLPINKTCKVEFETDAENDYFDRADSPGVRTIEPHLLEHGRLFNGKWEGKFRVPDSASVGQRIEVDVTVSDVETDAVGQPHQSRFIIEILPENVSGPNPPGKRNPPGQADKDGKRAAPTLNMPKIIEVYRNEWGPYSPFMPTETLRIKSDGNGSYDFIMFMENSYLLTELDRKKDEEKPLTRQRFKYGIVFAALGMMHHLHSRTERNMQDEEWDEGMSLEQKVQDACNGLARTIIPIVTTIGTAEFLRQMEE